MGTKTNGASVRHRANHRWDIDIIRWLRSYWSSMIIWFLVSCVVYEKWSIKSQTDAIINYVVLLITANNELENTSCVLWHSAAAGQLFNKLDVNVTCWSVTANEVGDRQVSNSVQFPRWLSILIHCTSPNSKLTELCTTLYSTSRVVRIGPFQYWLKEAKTY